MKEISFLQDFIMATLFSASWRYFNLFSHIKQVNQKCFLYRRHFIILPFYHFKYCRAGNCAGFFVMVYFYCSKTKTGFPGDFLLAITTFYFFVTVRTI